MNEFLYGVLPYIAFTVLVGGTIIRYAQGERGWTTKSSQFLSKDTLKLAGPMFHIGLFMAFGGHVIGVLIPKFMTEAAGVDEHLYHFIALAGGIPAGILFALGFIMLMIRRFGNDKMKVNTSGVDKILYLILAVTIFSGFAGTLSGMFNHFDYRETISPWFRSLLMLDPQIQYMENIPIFFKVHMLGWCLTAILFPMSRLVHCLSFPFEYFCRSNIVYRRK